VGAVFRRCGVLPVWYLRARTRRTRLAVWPALLPYCLGVLGLVVLSAVFRRTRGGGSGGGSRGPICLGLAGSPAPVFIRRGGVLVFVFCLALLACHPWPYQARGPALSLSLLLACLFAVCAAYGGRGQIGGKS
jgi:hypothetical protein